MEKKEYVKLLAILIILSLAAIIYFRSKESSSGIEEYKGQAVYIKCTNPKCGYIQKMDKAEYFQIINDKYGGEEKGFDCPECGRKSYRAMECSKCGAIFIRGAVRGDLVDRCPECRHSDIEEENKR